MDGRATYPDAAAALDETLPTSGGLDSDDRAEAALAYAAAGLLVFPLHAPDAAGRCSCRRDCGRDNGKHPRTTNGVSGATADPERVSGWWATWPDANIGVATGARSGIVVVDVDPGRGGEDAIAALEAAHGELPPTWAVETGGGGLHLYFRHPGGRVPTRAGKLGPGLDVRGDGGYAVAPPSRHRSGARYRWGASWHPARVPLAAVPPWLLALMVAGAPPRIIPPAAVPLRGSAGRNDPGAPAPPIAEGERNATLTSLAGVMRRRGFGEAAILGALLAENEARCAPPLDPAEVEKIARSVARYAPEPPPTIGAGRGRRRPAFVEFVGGKAVAR